LGAGLNLLTSSLFQPQQYPYLRGQEGAQQWRLVQDPRLISEAIIPLHPVVPNPYTLLAQIPPGATHISVLDLKDAFFCILLHHASQPHLPFRTQPEKQVIWTVLLQEFRDSPHLSGLALAQDLVEWATHKQFCFNIWVIFFDTTFSLLSPFWTSWQIEETNYLEKRFSCARPKLLTWD
jgi:hypothetical protein